MKTITSILKSSKQILVYLLVLGLLSQSLASKFEVITTDRPIHVNMMPNDKLESVMIYHPNNTFQFIKNQTVIAQIDQGSLEWKVPAYLNYLKVKGSTHYRTIVGKDFIQIRNW